MSKSILAFAGTVLLLLFSGQALASVYGVVQWNEYAELPTIVNPADQREKWGQSEYFRDAPKSRAKLSLNFKC